ncbi:hypothetical protein [Mucilaginibacter sp. SP1R1]|uniref:hypothetical protein n=1 Tax=Mucilaginibacter sp. SP1R1 TaxID=2723091 RepID=UPI0016200BBC|nr:hypothetical protein [Mucilaginibacter sp. SP1R1]MBB6149358.1 hypothetical protein [Mucilaginibacter sp. SP1R1]
MKTTWANCVAFDKVNSAETFVQYIKKCQIETTFFFNGSTDDSLAEQLKSLYLKQEFSKFVFTHQGLPPSQLLSDFRAFINEVKPTDLAFPTWNAGVCSLDGICKSQSVNQLVEKQ